MKSTLPYTKPQKQIKSLKENPVLINLPSGYDSKHNLNNTEPNNSQCKPYDINYDLNHLTPNITFSQLLELSTSSYIFWINATFFKESVELLGHTVSIKGVSPIPNKINFIPSFASISKPLFNLLKKGNTFSWGKTEQKSFEEFSGSFEICYSVIQFGWFKCSTNVEKGLLLDEYDIRRQIFGKNLPPCQIFKPQLLNDLPFSKVELDIVGPLPTTKKAAVILKDTVDKPKEHCIPGSNNEVTESYEAVCF
ncbi:hypothetical protein PIROE2DRAFT_11971 [Piromyces sp. E2]|nr:hypothetical protein PIROE2DRAFT_11971 [Piromyces sp. E2]|eukprot:OUM61904.1 hypothetical protein PIROE2DRAFT_11971 [Piromyces sp. E2]